MVRYWVEKDMLRVSADGRGQRPRSRCVRRGEYMTETEHILLQLTGRALFDMPAAFDSAATDWEALYREARNQALPLLIWDAFTEEERACIPDAVATRWEQSALLHIMKNEQLLYEQTQVLQQLDAAGILCVILKGSASAACYPNPSLRVMGDIDLLVKPEQQREAVKVLQAHGYGEVLEETHHCHMTISKGEITVEVHWEPNGLLLNGNAESLREIRRFLGDAVERRQFTDGLPVPADDQQALILLLHKMEHFFLSGLGLRQLCDWAVFVGKKMNVSSAEGRRLWETLRPRLAAFGILNFTGIMTRICIEYLGLPKSSAPWAMEYDAELSRKVAEQILREGNFGQKAEKYGERLFSNPNAPNRIVSLFRVMNDACQEYWPVCGKYPPLRLAAPFLLLGRYLRLRAKGQRPKVNLVKLYRQSGADQKLYQELRPFVGEE